MTDPIGSRREYELEAEVNRLRLKLEQAEKIAKLLPESAAEIERLRAALKELSEAYCCNCFSYPCTNTKEIAQLALRDKP